MIRTFFIIIAIIIVAYASVFLSGFFENNVIDIKLSDEKSLIIVASPIKDSEVSSPLRIVGRAKGQWFFEGSFPIVLVDSYGNTIAESHATAQSEWTTNEFVDFLGNIEFNNYIKGSKAILILKKDNPSGMVENDDSIKIPIILK